jgi:hypothetical protein
VLEIKLARVNLKISVLEFNQKVHGFAVFANNLHVIPQLRMNCKFY